MGPGNDEVTFWTPIVGGAIIACNVIYTLWLKFWEGAKHESHPGRIVLEQAELADMSGVRALGPKLDTLTRIFEEGRDETHERLDRITAAVDRIEKEAEIDRRIAADRERRTQVYRAQSD